MTKITVPSTTGGPDYEIDLHDKTCTCMAFRYGHGKPCKHIMALAGEGQLTLSLEEIELANKKHHHKEPEPAPHHGHKLKKPLRFNPLSPEGELAYNRYEKLLRTRLSRNFILRDFMFCTYNDFMGICNIPDDPAKVIKSGKQLCKQVLEPIVARWGRFAITYGYQNRNGMEESSPEMKKDKPTSSAPHEWDRGTFGDKVYTRVDILPYVLEDEEATKEEFGEWMMMNLDIDLLMQWEKSNVLCITISPMPRRVWLKWTPRGKGDNGSNKVTYWGEEFWLKKFPAMDPEERPKFYPSETNGKMWWGGK